MKNSNIYILTGSVHSGKTTALKNWLTTGIKAEGFLAEDKNGLRCLTNLKTTEKIPLQKKEHTSDDDILVGKYIFSKTGFDAGKNIIEHAHQCKSDWFIIDELGKLEMKNQGFEPELTECFNHFRDKTNGKLLVVIRDYLLADAIEKYQLQEAQIITVKELKIDHSMETKALVLAGGTSKRMGTDKAFIKYHEKEQIYHLADMLISMGLDTYLSINNQQESKISSKYNYIKDKYPDCGPLSGILSAFDKNSHCRWLVIGCDYPKLQKWDINYLLFEAKQFNKSATYYLEKEGFYLPTIGIYFPDITLYLQSALDEKSYAMQNILKNGNALKVKPLNLDRFDSIDTPKEKDNLEKQLNER